MSEKDWGRNILYYVLSAYIDGDQENMKNEFADNTDVKNLIRKKPSTEKNKNQKKLSVWPKSVHSQPTIWRKDDEAKSHESDTAFEI